jgi:lanosterol synthase
MSHANGATKRKEKANGAVNGKATGVVGSNKTDYTRWRLENVRGCQIWKYLESDEACREWPQSVADKYHLGMDTVSLLVPQRIPYVLCSHDSQNQPNLPPAKTPLQCVSNGLSFFSKLQLDPGNWACDYGGPMFLLPGLVITWYVTETPIPSYYATEMKAYLFARAHPEDGGWGLHIEGESSVFGIVMNYTALRILGVDSEDERMRKARATLWKLGGALRAPHWAKFWMAVLGVMEWDVVNPVPPELWYVLKSIWSWKRLLMIAGSYLTGSRSLHGAGGSTCDKSFVPCRSSTRDAGLTRSTT